MVVMSYLKPSPPEAVFYEDERLYACLAYAPIADGHCVVAWKDDVEDLHLLSREDYEHLMWAVERARDVLLESLGLDKVYLLYMDEVNHVHWHLVPRREEKGFTALSHEPQEIEDFSLADKLRDNFSL